MRRLYLAITAAALLAAAPRAFAQAPVIETGGVQNAASNIALTSIAPQVLVTIRGQNLATSTETASGFPLPTSLGGATVTFTGTAGPLRALITIALELPVDSSLRFHLDYGGIAKLSTSTGAWRLDFANR